MAFDHNLISKDLQPLNVVRTVDDEPRIAPVITTTRNVEGFCPNPSQNVADYSRAMPVYYSTAVPNSGIMGLGYRNMVVPVSDVLGWGAPQVQLPVGQVVRGNPGIGLGGNGSAGSRVSYGSAADQTSNEGRNDSVSGRKVKFLCSFGGKILPRPSDGMLRYVGGQTRIISVRRDVSYGELVQRMEDVYGQPLVIKYQLPGEGLDALVSVSSSDDLDNMMDEHSKLNERLSDGSAKLRVFLFSTAELDPAGMVKVMDLNDSGKIYLDAINGIVEGVVGGEIMRKESIASAASTQNSDLSGVEGFDNSTLANKGVVTETQTIKTASPRENSATSHEKNPRLVCSKPSPNVFVETSAVPLGIPMTMSEPNQPFSSHPIDMERSVALTLQQQQQLLGFESQRQPQQLGFDVQQQRLLSFESQQQQFNVDVQQPGVEFSPHAPHFQAQIAPRQSHGDYVQIPGQLRFPGAQPLGTPGSVNPQQFVRSGHMTMNPSSSYVTLRPNMIQATMPAQSQQTQLDTYSDGSVFAPRFIQLPVNQDYNGYQAQVQSAVIGGGFGWRPFPPPEQVVYSDGVVTRRAEKISEKESVANGDSNSVYHSPRQDDDLRAWQTNTECLGINTQPMIQGHMNQQFVTPQSETVEIFENLEAMHETEKIVIQNVAYADHCKIPAPPAIVGLASDVNPTYGMFTGTTSQYCQEVKIQQQFVPTQYEIKSDALANKPMYSNASPVVGGPLQIAEHTVQALPDSFSCNYPGIVLKEEALECSTASTNVRPVQGRMEAIGTYPSDISVNNERFYSPNDRARYGDMLDHKQQQIASSEVHLDNTFSKPMLVDTRQITPIETSQCSDTEMSYPHQFRPVESHEVEQVHTLGTQGPYLLAHTRIPQMACNEIAYSETAFPGALSTYVTDNIQPITEWKDDTTWLQSSSNAPTSLSPPNRIGEIQEYSNSFFSNQDTWSTWHDTHFPPPRSNKTPTNTEAYQTRDPFAENFFDNSRNTQVRLENEHQLPSGDIHREFSLEHIRSSKGSGEELIKQELQAVAEGVAASVLSPESASAYEWNESVSEESQDRGTQSSTVEKQHRAQVEDMQTKLPEKANFGFPASDGIGRLQIILNSDLEELQELGSGTFGTVYHGKWRGTDVAIKRINERCFVGKPSEQERMRDDFWNEAINLADLHHPNVVAFYGVVLDGPGGSVATVTEFMVNGSLRTALQKNERNLDKRKRLLIAMDVAFGMEYLHGKNIVHFDLKSDNLLVNLRDQHRPICKVGDLGLSKVKCQTLISGGVRGTLPWMAPELLNGSSSLVSEKVDVFSFGIVMWELLTGDEPYADLHYGAIIGGIVSNTLRPPIPESCDLEWRSLMEKCWSADPPERPNFSEIANQLRAMSAKIPLKGQSNAHPELIQK